MTTCSACGETIRFSPTLRTWLGGKAEWCPARPLLGHSPDAIDIDAFTLAPDASRTTGLHAALADLLVTERLMAGALDDRAQEQGAKRRGATRVVDNLIQSVADKLVEFDAGFDRVAFVARVRAGIDASNVTGQS